MGASLTALLAAAVVAASPQPAPRRVAAASPREAVEQLDDLMLQALPPPPNVVVRQTRYYGSVTIDHRAHLERRVSCKRCHGPTAVTKLEFTPKVAHARCVGCHQEVAAGPTRCQGCHVKTAPPPVQLAALTPPPPPPPPQPNPANVAAALSALDAAQARPDGTFGREAFRRAFELGVVAGRDQGVTVRLDSHQDFVVVSQSIDRMTSGAEARTIGLFGGGLSRPLARGLSVEGLALAGFDVFDRPVVALLPALGARAGLEWRPRLRFVSQLNASVTTVFDLSRRTAGARDVGGTSVYATVGAGFALPPR